METSKQIDTLIKSVEKLVRLDLERKEQIQSLEKRINNLEQTINQQDNEIKLAKLALGAADEAHDYIYNDLVSWDGVEEPLTKEILNKNLEDYIKRTGVTIDD